MALSTASPAIANISATTTVETLGFGAARTSATEDWLVPALVGAVKLAWPAALVLAIVLIIVWRSQRRGAAREQTAAPQGPESVWDWAPRSGSGIFAAAAASTLTGHAIRSAAPTGNGYPYPLTPTLAFVPIHQDLPAHTQSVFAAVRNPQSGRQDHVLHGATFRNGVFYSDLDGRALPHVTHWLARDPNAQAWA